MFFAFCDESEPDLPTFFAEDITITETDEDQYIDVKIKLLSANEQVVTVTYSTEFGTAVKSLDYEDIDLEKVIFEIGELEKTIQIKIIGDNFYEKQEVFYVNFIHIENVANTQHSTQITVLDDDDLTRDFSIDKIFSNTFVVDFDTTDVLNFHWEVLNGIPDYSMETSEMFSFGPIGTHEINLYYTTKNGSSSKKKSIEILNVNEQYCWKFSTVQGALIVGPWIGSSEWFSSVENGLIPEQLDDSFCFSSSHNDNTLNYNNNGYTVNPFNDFAIEEFDPPNWSWTISKFPNFEGLYNLTLTSNFGDKPFIGTWDSGPIYDIVSIDENELILRSPVTDIDGNAMQGFFEFILVPE